jgi:hypothetical protein
MSEVGYEICSRKTLKSLLVIELDKHVSDVNRGSTRRIKFSFVQICRPTKEP